jgi:hypothetical protein
VAASAAAASGGDDTSDWSTLLVDEPMVSAVSGSSRSRRRSGSRSWALGSSGASGGCPVHGGCGGDDDNDDDSDGSANVVVPPPRAPGARTIEGPTPVELPFGTTVVDVACGRHHTLILGADGCVMAMGSDAYGQLGRGGTDRSPCFRPTGVAGALYGCAVVGLAAGDAHSAFVSHDGRLFACGSNEMGQVGSSGSVVVVAPETPRWARGLRFRAVACGAATTVALERGGRVRVCGATPPALGRPAAGHAVVVSALLGTPIVSVAAGGASCAAVDAAGSCYLWGASPAVDFCPTNKAQQGDLAGTGVIRAAWPPVDGVAVSDQLAVGVARRAPEPRLVAAARAGVLSGPIAALILGSADGAAAARQGDSALAVAAPWPSAVATTRLRHAQLFASPPRNLHWLLSNLAARVAARAAAAAAAGGHSSARATAAGGGAPVPTLFGQHADDEVGRRIQNDFIRTLAQLCCSPASINALLLGGAAADLTDRELVERAGGPWAACDFRALWSIFASVAALPSGSDLVVQVLAPSLKSLIETFATAVRDGLYRPTSMREVSFLVFFVLCPIGGLANRAVGRSVFARAAAALVNTDPGAVRCLATFLAVAGGEPGVDGTWRGMVLCVCVCFFFLLKTQFFFFFFCNFYVSLCKKADGRARPPSIVTPFPRLVARAVDAFEDALSTYRTARRGLHAATHTMQGIVSSAEAAATQAAAMYLGQRLPVSPGGFRASQSGYVFVCGRGEKGQRFVLY